MPTDDETNDELAESEVPVDEVLQRMSDLVTNALVADSVDSLSQPHVLICHDPETGFTAYSGPFDDGMAALVAAQQTLDEELEPEQACRMHLQVAPLSRPGVPGRR